VIQQTNRFRVISVDRIFVALIAAVLVVPAVACANYGRETKVLIARIESQIRPGMPRSQVEAALADLDLWYAPQPGPGSPIWVHTPYEEDPGRLSWASIEIFFNSDDCVERVDARYMFSGI